MTEFDEPHPAYVRQRFRPLAYVEAALEANEIMMRTGSVYGARYYPTKDAAKWAMRRVIRDMVELRLHARDDLCEHVESREAGWIWSIEYRGDS